MEQIKASEVQTALAFIDELAKAKNTTINPLALQVGKINVDNVNNLLQNPKFIAIFLNMKKLIQDIQEVLGDADGNIKYPKAINLVKYLKIGKIVFTNVIDIVKIIIDLKNEVATISTTTKSKINV